MNDCNEATDRLARVLSHLLNPLAVGAPILTYISYHEQGFRTDLILPALEVCAVCSIIPLIYLLILLRLGVISDFFIGRREERVWFYPILPVVFFVGGRILAYHQAAPLLVALMYTAILSVTLAFFINARFKISMHMMGIGALSAAFLESLGTVGLPILLLIPLTAWARLRIRAHTPKEVFWGTVYGFGMTAVQLQIFL